MTIHILPSESDDICIYSVLTAPFFDIYINKMWDFSHSSEGKKGTLRQFILSYSKSDLTSSMSFPQALWMHIHIQLEQNFNVCHFKTKPQLTSQAYDSSWWGLRLRFNFLLERHLHMSPLGDWGRLITRPHHTVGLHKERSPLNCFDKIHCGPHNFSKESRSRVQTLCKHIKMYTQSLSKDKCCILKPCLNTIKAFYVALDYIWVCIWFVHLCTKTVWEIMISSHLHLEYRKWKLHVHKNFPMVVEMC